MKKIFIVFFGITQILSAMQPSSLPLQEYYKVYDDYCQQQVYDSSRYPYYDRYHDLHEQARTLLENSSYTDPVALGSLHSMAPFFPPVRRTLFTHAVAHNNFNAGFYELSELVKVGDIYGMASTASALASYRHKIDAFRNVPEEEADSYALALARSAALPNSPYQVPEAFQIIEHFEEKLQAHHEKRMQAAKQLVQQEKDKAEAIIKEDAQALQEQEQQKEKRQLYARTVTDDLKKESKKLIDVWHQEERNHLLRQLGAEITKVESAVVTASQEQENRKEQKKKLIPPLSDLKKTTASIIHNQQEQGKRLLLQELHTQATIANMSPARWQLIEKYSKGDTTLDVEPCANKALLLIEEVLEQMLKSQKLVQNFTQTPAYTCLEEIAKTHEDTVIKKRTHGVLSKIAIKRLEKAPENEKEQRKKKVYYHLSQADVTDSASLMTLIELAPSAAERAQQCKRLMEQKNVLPEQLSIVRESLHKNMQEKESSACLLLARYYQQYPDLRTVQELRKYYTALAVYPAKQAKKLWVEDKLQRLQKPMLAKVDAVSLYDFGRILLKSEAAELRTYAHELIQQSARTNHVPAQWHVLFSLDRVAVDERAVFSELAYATLSADHSEYKDIVVAGLAQLEKDKQHIQEHGKLLLSVYMNGIPAVIEKDEVKVKIIAQRLIKAQASTNDEREAALWGLKKYGPEKNEMDICLYKVARSMLQQVAQQRDVGALSDLLELNGDSTPELVAQLPNILLAHQSLSPHARTDFIKRDIPQKLKAFAERVNEPRIYFSLVRFFDANADHFKKQGIPHEVLDVYLTMAAGAPSFEIKREIIDFCIAHPKWYKKALELADLYFSKKEIGMGSELPLFFVEISQKITKLAREGYIPARLYAYELEKFMARIGRPSALGSEAGHTDIFYEVWQSTRNETGGILKHYNQAARVYMAGAVAKAEDNKEESVLLKLDRYYKAMKMFMEDDPDAVIDMLLRCEDLIATRKHIPGLRDLASQYKLYEDFESYVKKGYGWACFAGAKIMFDRAFLVIEDCSIDSSFIVTQLESAVTLCEEAGKAKIPYNIPPGLLSVGMIRDLQAQHYLKCGDFEKADAVYESSALAGHALSLYNRALLRMYGLYNDPKASGDAFMEALDLMITAAEKGSGEAFGELAMICRQGCGLITATGKVYSRATRDMVRKKMRDLIDTYPDPALKKERHALFAPVVIALDEQGTANRFELAKGYYAISDYKNARQLFYQECAAGNVAAHRYLGLMCLQGDLLERSPERAYKHFGELIERKVRAERSGDAKGAENIGQELMALRKDLGFLEAQLVRVQEAVLRYRLSGEPKDADVFLSELKKSDRYISKQSDPLTRQLIFSSGIARTIEECIKERQETVVLFPLVSFYAHRIMQFGIPSEEHRAQATAPFVTLEDNLIESLISFNGQNIAMRTMPENFLNDTVEAITLMADWASAANNEKIMSYTRLLGMIHIIGHSNGRKDCNFEQGLKCLQIGKAHNDPESIYLLGLVQWHSKYLSSKQHPRSNDLAIENMRIAAKMGHPQANLTLGSFLSGPHNGRANITEAEACYTAALGSKQHALGAQFALARIYFSHHKYFEDGLSRAKKVFEQIIALKSTSFFYASLLYRNKMALDNPDNEECALSDQQIFANFEKAFINYCQDPTRRVQFSVLVEDLKIGELVKDWVNATVAKTRSSTFVADAYYIMGLFNYSLGKHTMLIDQRISMLKQAATMFNKAADACENPINVHALLARLYLENDGMPVDFVKVQQHILKGYAALHKRKEQITDYQLLQDVSNEFKVKLAQKGKPGEVSLKVLLMAEVQYLYGTNSESPL